MVEEFSIDRLTKAKVITFKLITLFRWIILSAILIFLSDHFIFQILLVCILQLVYFSLIAFYKPYIGN